jgi:hypothetical protein
MTRNGNQDVKQSKAEFDSIQSEIAEVAKDYPDRAQEMSKAVPAPLEKNQSAQIGDLIKTQQLEALRTKNQFAKEKGALDLEIARAKAGAVNSKGFANLDLSYGRAVSRIQKQIEVNTNLISTYLQLNGNDWKAPEVQTIVADNAKQETDLRAYLQNQVTYKNQAEQALQDETKNTTKYVAKKWILGTDANGNPQIVEDTTGGAQTAQPTQNKRYNPATGKLE